MRAVALAAAALVACGSEARDAEPDSAKPGTPCQYSSDCKYPLDCFQGACAPDGKLGEVCKTEADYRRCDDGYCWKGRCVAAGKDGEGCFDRAVAGHDYRPCEGDVTCYDERCVADVEAHERAIRLAAEKRMFEAAGAKMPDAESDATVDAGPKKPARPVKHRGDAVRVVEITNPGFAFAACRDDERMIGGGCESDDLTATRPDAFTGGDTVGARWVCRSSNRKAEVKAFALCVAP